MGWKVGRMENGEVKGNNTNSQWPWSVCQASMRSVLFLLSQMITQTQRSRHVSKSHTTSEGLGLGFALGSMAVGCSASPQRLGLVRNSP